MRQQSSAPFRGFYLTAPGTPHYTNLHCVVLAGWSGDDYQIADHISGWQRVSPALFWSSFDAMAAGRRLFSPVDAITEVKIPEEFKAPF